MTSLGLFIIDQNQYPSSWGRATESDIVGGGLSYAVIGARMVCGKDKAKQICGIVDMGTDFPPSLKEEIDSWGTGVIFRENPNRLTTRGVNVYREDGVRDFKYLSPKKRILAEDIVATSPLVYLRSFHFCCAIDRCQSTIDTFLSVALLKGHSKPKFIFEPFPDICLSLNLEELQALLPKVDVYSPNLHEAASFLQMEHILPSVDMIRDLADKFFDYQNNNSGTILRCGELGCYVKSATVSIMLPPYHINQDNVIDVTGGGNSFCGAFITAFEISGDWLLSAVLATIASGIVIESLGMPQLEELRWNGLAFLERLVVYLDRNRSLINGISVSSIDWL